MPSTNYPGGLFAYLKSKVARAALGGAGATPVPPFTPASVAWYVAADPDQGLAASAGKLVSQAPAFGASQTLTGAPGADVIVDGGPAAQDMLRYGSSAYSTFTLVDAAAFFLCGFFSLRTLTGDTTLLGYSAGTTNGIVRINSGGAGMAIRRAGGSFVTIPLPFTPQIGRFYFLRFEVYADNTAQAFLNGVGGTRTAISGTTTRFERFGGVNAMDVGPIFVSLGASPADIDANMMGYFPGWLPTTFYVDDMAGSDTSVQPWSATYPLKTLSAAGAFKALPGDTFNCVGDFVGQRLNPGYSGTAEAPITFTSTSGGACWGGTVVTSGWAADGSGIGTRALAYDPPAVWVHAVSGKTWNLVRSTGLAVNRSFEYTGGNLRVRFDGFDFAAAPPIVRISETVAAGTSFLSTAQNYITAVGWDVRHRSVMGLDAAGANIVFRGGVLAFNVNDGSGGNGASLSIEDSYVIGNGRNPAQNSEGDNASHHGTGHIRFVRCVSASAGFGGFQHQQGITAEAVDCVILDNVRDTRLSYNENSNVGALTITGSVIVVTDRSEDGWGPYLEAGHPAASALTVNSSTIVCERASKTGTRGVYWPDGHGSASDNILFDFETGLAAVNGRVVTGAGNLSNTVLKSGSDNSATGVVADPMFVNAAVRNFNLQPGSPAAGKGAGATALALMLDYQSSEFALAS